MGLFRRRRDSAGAERVAALARFWDWWSGAGAAEVGGALEEGRIGDATALVAARVHAVDPGLAGDLGPGTTSTHRLVVTADGDADLRPLARRWRLAGPPDDAQWSFADARPPVEQPRTYRVQLGAWDVDLVRASAAARVAHAAVDATVFHPDFHHLDEGTRDVAARLLLDALLGEAAVETWLGEVRGTDIEPLDPVPLLGLRAVVRDLAAEHTDPDGRPRWILLNGTAADGTAVGAAARAPLRAATDPHLDTHVAVAVPYADRSPDGLPGPDSRRLLATLQQQVEEHLGDRGSVLAHESHAGVRLLHAYLDSTTDAMDRLGAVVAGWSEAGAAAGVSRPVRDPAWARVAHLRP